MEARLLLAFLLMGLVLFGTQYLYKPAPPPPNKPRPPNARRKPTARNRADIDARGPLPRSAAARRRDARPDPRRHRRNVYR